MSERANPVAVLVADDHPLYREALGAAISRHADLELAGEAGDGDSAIEAVRAVHPDVAVIDLRMPGVNGIDLVKALMHEGLSTRLVLLSAYMDRAQVYAALAAGAAGFLSKDMEATEICEAIIAVARGETVIAPQAQAGLAEEIRARSPDDEVSLTEREHEILRLVATGCSAPEIGRRLFISTGTVKTHLHHIYKKFGVPERGAAVAEAMRRGWVE